MSKLKNAKVSDLPGMTGPGVAPVIIPEINKLADEYVSQRDKRCKMTPKEITAKGKLIDAIHAHADELGRDPSGSIVYRYDDLIVTLAPGKEKLKVKEAKEIDDEDDE